MLYRQLGRTGLLVSRFCFGSLTLGPLCAGLPIERGGALLAEAITRGVTFIDTAEQYRTYPYIRAALDQSVNQDGIVVSSKTFAETAAGAAYALEEARMQLRRNKLDIFLLHEVRDAEDFAARREAWQVLLDARANGVIQAVGISTHSAAMAAWAARQPEIDVLHPLLNVAGVGILDGGVAEMLAAVQAAHRAGKGVFAMKAMGGGALMRQAKAALDWAFARPELDAVAVGCKDINELITDLGWLAGEDPPEAELVKLLDRNIVFDKEPRCHGCGLCVKRCAGGAMVTGRDGTAEWHKERCLYCGYCIAACPWFCISFC